MKMSPLKEGDEQQPSENSTSEVRDSKITIASSVCTFQSSERVDNSCYGKFERILRKVYRVTSSLLGIIVLLVAYSFLGAWIFMMIELSHEESYKHNITLARAKIMNHLLNSSDDGNESEKLKVRLQEMLTEYEADIMAAYKAGVTSASTEEKWGFWSSLFFCGTVYTTIGYGHIAPATDLGRGICMLYAALGIPLALLVLAELGKRFTVALKYLWAFVRRYYYTGYCKKLRIPFKNAFTKKEKSGIGGKSNDSKSDSESNRESTRLVYGYAVNEKFNLPITVALAILVIYILLGAFMYSLWEEWGYLEAFYFVFISISTIGFGDVIPAHPKFFILSSIYIFIGLSLVSMCINVAIEFFTATADMAKEKMGKATKTIGKKVTAAKDKVHQVSHDIKANLKDETDKIRHIDETIKKWTKTKSRSNTPVSDESASTYDQKQLEEESSIRRDSSISEDTLNQR